MGCERFYYVSARLSKKGEGKKESALNEATPTAHSLDATRDLKKNGLKLNIHKRFEDDETRLLLLENRLSEVIQNNSLPV